jgi:hypothetical protein
MATRTLVSLELEQLLVPSKRIEIELSDDDPRQIVTLAPGKITSLADATPEPGTSHNRMLKLSDVDYDKVKLVNLSIEGLGGFGSCCPTLKKEDYEELRRRCHAATNEKMIGKHVTGFYVNLQFYGFLAPNTCVSKADIERS